MPLNARSISALESLYRGDIDLRVRGAAPRVAVVGAGIGGLVAAHLLQLGGAKASVFEAASEVGGRIRTDFGQLEPGVVTELGAEFVDSTHTDIRALARLFDLSLIDTGARSEQHLQTAYWFDGRHRTEQEVLGAYQPVARRISADIAQLSSRITHLSHSPADARFDRQSIEEYLDRLEMEPWLRSLLSVAYETEFGLPVSEQSCLNMLTLIGTDLTRGFEIFGRSDERYKVREGLARLTDGLSRRVGSRLHRQHRLVRLAQRGTTFRLTFESPGGAREVDADAVVLALPFTLLRQVEITGIELPPAKRAAIAGLGYGTNAKVIVGLHTRLWREQGFDGGLYCDGPMQTGWDGSRQRAGERGVYTWFLGGKPGASLGRGTPERHANRLSREMDAVHPGFVKARTGSAHVAHWAGEPLSLGSYACYRPGQWTTISGVEAAPVDGLHFAGEHCSARFQGYMNGAAETGRRAALAILARGR